MRLTSHLFKWGKIPGKLNQGKHQLPHYFSPIVREQFVKDLQVELTNEMWLTRPYLSKEQESFLPNGTRFTAAEVRWRECEDKQSDDEVFAFNNQKYRINMRPHVTLEERWEPLEREERWEEVKHDDQPVHKFAKYSQMAEIKRLPERWPRAVEKWGRWSKVTDFHKKSES